MDDLISDGAFSPEQGIAQFQDSLPCVPTVSGRVFVIIIANMDE
jgi:hypothetical protein